MKFVTYEQFGAVGDGITNDFAAIKAAHDYANENSLPVKADGEKTYYIGDTRIDGQVEVAVIRTDVEWGSAKFIVDDTDIGYYDGTDMAKYHIFAVKSDYDEYKITDPEILGRLSGIGEGTTKIDLELGYPALLDIHNKDMRVFRRYGNYGKNSEVGVDQHEVLLIDGEGNVDPSTPFMFNYEKLTSVDVIRTDIKPITVSGGIFTTRASRVNAVSETGRTAGYFKRGICINRSYATLDGVEHYIEGEITTFEHRDKGLRGPHYYGFFSAERANLVTLRNCVLTGRRYYRVAGTYDFLATSVNIIRLEGCRQSNFTIKTEDGDTVYSMAISPVSGTLYHWGIGGTNYCKNMEYVDCTLSRFDAHAGLYNGKIINCSVNFMELTGKGELLIENMKWHSAGSNLFLYLRGDYGSTWDGTIKVRNSTIYPAKGDMTLCYHSYVNWDFGYICHFPNLDFENVKIEGLETGAKVKLLTEERSAGNEPNMHLPETAVVPHNYEDGTTDMKNFNPIAPPEYIKLDMADGEKVHLSKLPFFEKTDFTKCTDGTLIFD